MPKVKTFQFTDRALQHFALITNFVQFSSIFILIATTIFITV